MGLENNFQHSHVNVTFPIPLHGNKNYIDMRMQILSIVF